MPKITVSDSLYRQLTAESADQDAEAELWAMLHHFTRRNSPAE